MEFKEFREKVEVKFRVIEGRYIVSKVEEVPKFSDRIFSMIIAKNEITVIAQKGIDIPAISEEKFYKLITFEVELPLDLIGFLSYISSILSKEKISLFVISAYTTDHLFIKERDLDKTIKTLKKDGMILS
jgi:hypothetical protein